MLTEQKIPFCVNLELITKATGDMSRVIHKNIFYQTGFLSCLRCFADFFRFSGKSSEKKNEYQLAYPDFQPSVLMKSEQVQISFRKYKKWKSFFLKTQKSVFLKRSGLQKSFRKLLYEFNRDIYL